MKNRLCHKSRHSLSFGFLFRRIELRGSEELVKNNLEADVKLFEGDSSGGLSSFMIPLKRRYSLGYMLSSFEQKIIDKSVYYVYNINRYVSRRC